MRKRGAIFLWIVLVVSVIIFAGLAILIFIGDDSESSEGSLFEDSSNSEINGNHSEQNSSTAQIKCSDYESQASCESGSENVSLSGGTEWIESECDSAGIECNCIWNANTSSCYLEAKNLNESTETFFDLVAISFNLTNNGCTNESEATNRTCDIGMIGTLKNEGTKTVEEDFAVHFLDVSEGFSLIKLFTVTESIASQEEKEFSGVYNVSYGDYFIKLKVDGANNIEESNEDNNEITKAIRIP